MPERELIRNDKGYALVQRMVPTPHRIAGRRPINWPVYGYVLRGDDIYELELGRSAAARFYTYWRAYHHAREQSRDGGVGQ